MTLAPASTILSKWEYEYVYDYLILEIWCYCFPCYTGSYRVAGGSELISAEIENLFSETSVQHLVGAGIWENSFNYSKEAASWVMTIYLAFHIVIPINSKNDNE